MPKTLKNKKCKRKTLGRRQKTTNIETKKSKQRSFRLVGGIETPYNVPYNNVNNTPVIVNNNAPTRPILSSFINYVGENGSIRRFANSGKMFMKNAVNTGSQTIKSNVRRVGDMASNTANTVKNNKYVNVARNKLNSAKNSLKTAVDVVQEAVAGIV